MGDFSFLNLVTAIFGFATAFILVFSPAQNQQLNRILGAGFLILAYRSLSIFIRQEDLLPNTFLLGTVSAFYYLIPPILYLYFKRIVNDEGRFSRSELVHFILPALAFLLLIFYWIRGFILNGEISLPEQTPAKHEISPFTVYVPVMVHALIIFVSSVFYIILSWRLVLTKLKKTAGEHPQVAKMRNWIYTLLIICTMLAGLLFMSVVVNWIFEIKVKSLNISNLNIFRSLVLITLFSRVLISRELLLGIPSISSKLPIAEKVPLGTIESDQSAFNESGKEDHSESGTPENTVFFDKNGWVRKKDLSLNESSRDLSNAIEQDKALQYIAKINTYLETAPYVNTGFDLKTMSAELQIPQYHLEYLFRYYNRFSFPEFRNTLRVNHVIKNIENLLHQNYTIEALGMKAGFSSRSSFFRVFKTITGNTPKHYCELMDKKDGGKIKAV